MAFWWWLLVATVAGAVEAALPGLVCIWFVAGGLAAFCAGFLGLPATWQLVVFGGVSVLLLAFLRPAAIALRSSSGSAEADVVGSRARVVEAIPAGGTGRVETRDGITWAAVSADGAAIASGEAVEVVSRKSVTLSVRPAADDGARARRETG